MSRFKKSTPWVVGVAGVASLTLSAWSWAQRGPLPPVVSMDPQAIAAANSLSRRSAPRRRIRFRRLSRLKSAASRCRCAAARG